MTLAPEIKGTSQAQLSNPQTLSVARQSENPEQATQFIGRGQGGHGSFLQGLGPRRKGGIGRSSVGWYIPGARRGKQPNGCARA